MPKGRYELCEICGKEYGKNHAPTGILCKCGKPAVYMSFPLGLLWYECEKCHNKQEDFCDVSWRLDEITPCLENYMNHHNSKVWGQEKCAAVNADITHWG